MDAIGTQGHIGEMSRDTHPRSPAPNAHPIRADLDAGADSKAEHNAGAGRNAGAGPSHDRARRTDTPSVALSWMALAWERAWRVLWPALTLTGIGLSVMLSGLLPRLPGWLHLAVLLGLAGSVIATALPATRAWRRPTLAEALHRLESSGGQLHRPLTASRDRLGLGAGDALSRALWRHHQTDMDARARALRTQPPHPGLSARDPRALRLIPLLLLFVTLTMAWPDPLGRLTAALSPRLGPTAPPAVAQVWITPPPYTGRAPVYIDASRDRAGAHDAPPPPPARAAIGPEPLIMPAGGTVLALLRGGTGAGRLDLGPSQPAQRLEATGETGQRLEITVTEGTRLRLTQGQTVLVDRPMTVAPDLPPEVALVAPPQGDPQGRLKIEYRAHDDHGITKVTAEIRRAGDQVLGAPIDAPLPVPTGEAGRDGGDRAEGRDLSAHPWAGTPVTLRLVATDAAGQTGTSRTVEMVLPERRFSHPVAQAVADLRRALVTRPGQARAVAVGLAALARDHGTYGDRLAIHLALLSAAARLAFDPEGQAQTEDLDLLWSIALALEGGALTLARRDLEQAREALREAIEQNAPREEIERRLAEVREALDRLMRELAEAMPLATLPPMAFQMPDGARMISPEDIDRMLDRMADLNDLGAQDAARAMLDQLEQMLRRLETARPPTADEMQAMAQANEMMLRLQDLAQRQRALLDETFRLDPENTERPMPRTEPFLDGMRPGETPEQWLERQLSRNEPPPRPDASEAAREKEARDRAARDMEARQRALREALERLMADLGEMTGQVPDSLGEANLAMRDAEQALSEGDTRTAAEAQGRALEALTQGQDQAMRQMMGPGGMGRMLGFGMMPGGPGQHRQMGPGFRPGFGRDPFNRSTGGADDDSVHVPTEPDTRRAHEILRELRRRANEPNRPAPEKDYLDRLMTPF